LFGPAENFGQSHGHLRRYAALPVYKFRKRIPRHPKGSGSVRNSPGCGGFFMVMGWCLSMVIDIIKVAQAVPPAFRRHSRGFQSLASLPDHPAPKRATRRMSFRGPPTRRHCDKLPPLSFGGKT
jgi:hypothetical protein